MTTEGSQPTSPSRTASEVQGVASASQTPETTAAAAGLYIHVPFCSAICPYCDFAVQVGKPEARRNFVTSLCREIQSVATAWQALGATDLRTQHFDTLYFGGGTPSFLEADELARILETLREHLPILDSARLFFEANPEDINRQRLEDWRRLGVATLSLGVQAFNDDDLKFLGRRHRARSAWHSIGAAKEAGFETLSIDLMYGLPSQNPASWRQTLKQAVALEPDHLSCYELEIHSRTSFGKQMARGILHPMPDKEQAELFVTTHRWLAERGFHGYEVSNFARAPHHESSHNRKYWDHTPYLGVGPSAHSYSAGQRWWNERSFATWHRLLSNGASPLGGREQLSPEDMALEAVMLALRTQRGIDLQLLRERYGCDLLRHNKERIETNIEAGLLHLEGRFLQATLEGWIVADALTANLVIKSDRLS